MAIAAQPVVMTSHATAIRRSIFREKVFNIDNISGGVCRAIALTKLAK